MKNQSIIGTTLIIWILLSLFLGFNSWNKSEIIKTNNQQIDSLKAELKELKKFERYGIIVGDSTLHVVSKFKIGSEPYKYLHKKRIHKGRNHWYLVLNEKTAVDLILMKY